MSLRFDCLYSHDFVRLASCVPRIEVADPAFNFAETMRLAARGDAAKATIMVFPELGLSAYNIDDLLFQDALLDAVEARIGQLVEASQNLFPVLVVGAPLRSRGQLYNAAVVIHRGSILGVVPKTYLPNYREFYERRHFASGAGVRDRAIAVAGREVPFGIDLLFRSNGPIAVCFHVEICEDVWVPLPPSTSAALAGAEVLINLSASNITIGKAETRRLLCASQSARAIAAYIYSAAGPGESTTDLAWDGHAAIFEYGDCLAESTRFATDSTLIMADVDLGRLRQERMRVNTFGDCIHVEAQRLTAWRSIGFRLDAPDAAVALQRTSHAPAHLQVAPDGTVAILFTMSDIRLLDPESLEELATLSAPQPGLLQGVEFSPDGTTLYSTAVGTVQLWDLRRLRQELAGLGLDWSTPSLPPAASAESASRRSGTTANMTGSRPTSSGSFARIDRARSGR